MSDRLLQLVLDEASGDGTRRALRQNRMRPCLRPGWHWGGFGELRVGHGLLSVHGAPSASRNPLATAVNGSHMGYHPCYRMTLWLVSRQNSTASYGGLTPIPTDLPSTANTCDSVLGWSTVHGRGDHQ